MSVSGDLVSIIMAAYNAEKTIRCAVESVISQTYSNWELIVVNDCSKDETKTIISEIAAQDSRVRRIDNEINSGVSISRQKGLEAARGTWIAVLDSDDMWMPDKLEKQLVFAAESSADLVFTASSFIDNEGHPIDWRLNVPSEITYRKLLKQNLISNSSVLVRKELYQRFYAIGDAMHEDFAMWLQITKNGFKACGLNEPLLIYRLANSSKSSNKFRAAKMNWNTYRYVGLNPVAASYYMCWYTINGLLKYRHLK